jgi:hypothetical protein
LDRGCKIYREKVVAEPAKICSKPDKMSAEPKNPQDSWPNFTTYSAVTKDGVPTLQLPTRYQTQRFYTAMAEIGLAASVIAVIQISQSVITQAYNYSQAVKNAKKDIERIESEMKDIGNVLIKLQDLSRRAERSGQSLDHWPTLVSIRRKGGPLSECELSLNCLLTELAPVDGWARVKERALWPHKMKNVEKTLQTITQGKKYFIEALNIEQA